jgi:hypothetical protein
MRWGALFDDLESQLIAAERALVEDQVGELARAEQALLTLADRLRPHRGVVEMILRCGVRVKGRPAEVAKDWLVLDAAPRSFLVPLRSVVTVAGLNRDARPEVSRVRRELTLGSALRALARGRVTVACHVDAGRAEALLVSGVIDVVGRDYIEIAHGGDDWGRWQTGGSSVLPLPALIAISSVG